jgi:hypothetical protein
MARHFAERGAAILGPLSFLSAVSEWRASCIVLLRGYSTKGRSTSAFQLVLYRSHEASTMTPQFIQPGNDTIDVELDHLTYSAYLLTLDPDLAYSVVMAAVDTSMEDRASNHDLLRRTTEMSLAQLRLGVSAASDRESLAVEALLYSDSSFATSRMARFLREQTDGNPILLLDSGERIAFVLHHVFGYSIKGAAAMAQISEKEYRAQLRKAYLQLASLQLGAGVIGGYMLGQVALA